MGKRQKLWARKARFQLLFQLGGICAQCNHSGNKRNVLEFDCIIPQGDFHHRLDTERRIIFYRRQYQQNNIQILCKKCNNIKSRQDRQYLDALGGTESRDHIPTTQESCALNNEREPF